MFRKRTSESLGSLGQNRRARRGAKLGIVVAILMALPGLVAGYNFVTGANSGSLTVGTTNQPGADCGFVDNQASGDANFIAFTSGGSSLTSGTIYQTVTGALSAVETGGTGGSGFEYLTDQLAFECKYSTGTSVTFNIQVCGYGQTVSGVTCSGTVVQVTGADWAVVEVTNALPSSANPTTATTSQECESSPVPWYSSVTANSANTWTTKPDYVYSLSSTAPEWLATGTTTTGGCIAGPSTAGTTSPLTSMSYSAASGTPMEYVGVDLVDESSTTGLEASGSPIVAGTTLFTIGFTASVT